LQKPAVIHQGRIRIELYDKKDELLVSREIDIRELQEKEAIKPSMVVDSEDRTARIVVRP